MVLTPSSSSAGALSKQLLWIRSEAPGTVASPVGAPPKGGCGSWGEARLRSGERQAFQAPRAAEEAS